VDLEDQHALREARDSGSAAAGPAMAPSASQRAVVGIAGATAGLAFTVKGSEGRLMATLLWCGS
jgi:hypothetical protein